MLEAFKEPRLHAKTLSVIHQANRIIREYQASGFTLTLRQLYYQFVSRGLIGNTFRNYKRLGSIINEGRLAGLIDWSAIEDRLRVLVETPVWRNPADIMSGVVNSYKEPLWATQDNYVEVWIEKDALIGVIETVCNRWRVPYFACRGHSSQSAQYEAGQRLTAACERGKVPTVLHLGDHDPSGLDMTRDNEDRLRMFMGEYGDLLTVDRLALNMPQVLEYSPPPNPVKDSDSRTPAYEAEHGDECWELDALDPQVISDLIDDAISVLVDEDSWTAAVKREDDNKVLLTSARDHWPSVAHMLKDQYDH